MSNPSTLLGALLIGFVASAFAPPPVEDSAQTSAARMAAVVKCIKVAQTQYPDDSDAQHIGRYQAYQECMSNAGQAP
jgi:hypothetical protein